MGKGLHYLGQKHSQVTYKYRWIYTCVLLPENLYTYFELSVQAWILYKAPQWNARYPNSCPERIKL